MFRIFLASTLVSKNMFLSSFIVAFEEIGFKTYYNASILRDTSTILTIGLLCSKRWRLKTIFASHLKEHY
jgi:hypothetical protein